jgi:hypothetical protein
MSACLLAIGKASLGHSYPFRGRWSMRAVPIHGIPAYAAVMDAKTRYRQRLKLQAALTRVIEVFIKNDVAGITADRTTAELAAQVVVWLRPFIRDAGVALPDPSKQEPDTARFGHVLRSRRRETSAR